MKKWVLGGGAILLGVACILLGTRVHDKSLQPVFEGESKALAHTVVVPSLDTPMPANKNVVWCASIQLAWNQLRTHFSEPVRLKGAEDLSDRMNRSTLSSKDLVPGSFYVRAGYVRDGVLQTIRREHEPATRALPAVLPADGLVSYAWIRMEVPFEHPFQEVRQKFVFTDSKGVKTPVSCFGLGKEQLDGERAARSQVRVYYADDAKKEFALDLCRFTKPYQIIVARLQPKSTLAETVAQLNKNIQEAPISFTRGLAFGQQLIVPNVYWKLRHAFSEMEGKVLENDPSGHLFVAAAAQTIEFKLDRSGAVVESDSKTLGGGSDVKDYLFDGPFLILIQKRDADTPLFVMWVDNAELLCKP
jgi:hypothetical protein